MPLRSVDRTVTRYMPGLTGSILSLVAGAGLWKEPVDSGSGGEHAAAPIPRHRVVLAPGVLASGPGVGMGTRAERGDAASGKHGGDTGINSVATRATAGGRRDDPGNTARPGRTAAGPGGHSGSAGSDVHRDSGAGGPGSASDRHPARRVPARTARSRFMEPWHCRPGRTARDPPMGSRSTRRSTFW